MSAQLNADELIETAQKATGLHRFDSESFREGLEVLVAATNADNRSDEHVALMGDSLVKLLADRLRVTDYLAQRPELLGRPIKRPVFVFGLPRTGTTLLSNLLACDPARRSPLTWEIDKPVPPATGATLYTDPRAVTRVEQHKAMLAARPEASKYYRSSPIYPNECIFFMAHDFKAFMLEARGKLPAYGEWLFSTDMTSAYDYHKRFLQLLQADAPGTWNLKMPSHALWLETLVKTYPDARLVWTHRDPFTATGSLCSLNSLGHIRFSGTVDKAWLGRNSAHQMTEHANRAMDARERMGEDSIVDVQYVDLMTNPLWTMRNLYKALGDDFTPEVEAAMQAWLDENPQGKFGRHEYRLSEFGLSVEQLAPGYERYLSRFDVAREG